MDAAIKNLDQELLGNSEILLAGGEVKIFLDVPGSPPTVLKLRFLKRKPAFTGRFRPWARSVGNSNSRARLAGKPFYPSASKDAGRCGSQAAVRLDLVARNVADNAEPPKSEDREVEILKASDVPAVLDALKVLASCWGKSGTQFGTIRCRA